MKVLLHSCCGPCTVYPLQVLQKENIEIEGYFYNPNIHPYREYKERLNSYKKFCDIKNLVSYIDDEYGLELFINSLKEKQLSINQRCPICYQIRLEKTALKALELGMDGFTTTLLVSPYQNHDLLKSMGKGIGERHGIEFIYRDFRPGFREAQKEARDMGLYMQTYCGCIFSEYDRYKPKKKK